MDLVVPCLCSLVDSYAHTSAVAPEDDDDDRDRNHAGDGGIVPQGTRAIDLEVQETKASTNGPTYCFFPVKTKPTSHSFG